MNVRISPSRSGPATTSAPTHSNFSSTMSMAPSHQLAISFAALLKVRTESGRRRRSGERTKLHRRLRLPEVENLPVPTPAVRSLPRLAQCKALAPQDSWRSIGPLPRDGPCRYRGELGSDLATWNPRVFHDYGDRCPAQKESGTSSERGSLATQVAGHSSRARPSVFCEVS